MKFKVKEYIGPNIVIGDTGKGLVRAKVAINNRPKVGDECDRPDTSCTKFEQPKAETESKPEAKTEENPKADGKKEQKADGKK